MVADREEPTVTARGVNPFASIAGPAGVGRSRGEAPGQRQPNFATARSVSSSRPRVDTGDDLLYVAVVMAPDSLGEFEQLVLLAIVQLGPEAYGMTIRRQIEERTERSVSIGALYTALERLERKGYVVSTMTDPTPQRGGRAKRTFRLQRGGATALKRSRDMLTRMWAGVSQDLKPERR